MSKTGWNRAIGSSKAQQNIITPPPPRRHHCGCWFIGKELLTMCNPHQEGMNQIMKQLQVVADARKQEKAETILSEQTEKLAEEVKEALIPPTPWVENVKASESVQVGIITPEENK